MTTLPSLERLQPRLLGGGLSEDDLAGLLAAARLIDAPPRRMLLRGHEDRVLLLLDGTAKQHLVTSDGEEVIDALVGPGHVAGLTTALGLIPSDVDLTSMEKVTGLFVSGTDLRYLVSERPDIARACLRVVVEQQTIAAAERAKYSRTTVNERVCQRLLELTQRWGHQEGDGIRVTLPIAQHELAAWSGASRESVAKILHGLRHVGAITTGRRDLMVLDTRMLRAASRHRGDDDLRDLLRGAG